jgi:hypothetical protein
MNNRLQFKHHGVESGYTVADGVFSTRQEAIDYIQSENFSLYGEPVVLRYKNEENEDDPYLMLFIGTVTNNTNIWRNNRYCIIDIHKTESEIADLREELEKAIKSLTLYVANSNTLELTAERTEDGSTFLSGNVRVAESHRFDGEDKFKENKLIETEDGLFIYIDLDYDENNDIIKFTLNNVEKDMQLDINNVTQGFYDERDESIHLKMKHGDDIVIDLEHLIAEWVVEGEAANSPIILKREEVGYGSTAHTHVEPWQDILSAEVRIADDRVNNILERTSDNRYLYVDGVASNIAYYKDGSKTNVKEVLDDLTKIKLSTDSQNILVNKTDGFFASTSLEYISSQNMLVFTASNQQPQTIRLNSFKMFENIYYDPNKEALVITYIDNEGKTKFTEIPIGEMLHDWEWEVNNYGHSVELQKVRMVQGPDQLSADVNISNAENNILTEVSHELFVKGTADNIKYGSNSNVETEIDRLKVEDVALNNKIDGEIARSIAEDERLQNEINAVSADTESRLKSIVAEDKSINVDNTDAINPAIKVNLSTTIEDGKENIIKLNNDGLYVGVDLDYYFESGTSKNVLVFRTTNGTKTFDLKTNSVVDKIYYDAVNEEIVIEYTVNGKRMPDVRIPVRDMIDEIDVQDTSSVKLTKIKDTSAGADIITADVIINSVHDDNILINDGGLYVSGGQIEVNKTDIAALKDRMTSAENSILALNDNIDNEIERSTREDEIHSQGIATNASAIEAETNRATAKENAIASDLANEISRANEAENAIADDVAAIENDYYFTVDNTNTITLSKEAQAKGSLIKASVNISADANNNIKEVADGIFSKVDLTYNPATNRLTFTNTNNSTEIALTSNSVVDKIYYDSTHEAIVIEYTVNGNRMPDVVVPVGDLINEWRVWDGHEGAIQLEKTRIASGTTEQDVLKASVVVSNVHDDNMLVNDNGALYVSSAPINVVSSATEENAEKIENIIIGTGLGQDGHFNSSSVIGRNYISDAQSVLDASLLLDSAVKGVEEKAESISGADTTYSVRLSRSDTTNHLSADVKLAQTPIAAQTEVTYTNSQYAVLNMRNLLKIINLVGTEKDSDTNGLFFDGSIDYGTYDTNGRISYEN